MSRPLFFPEGSEVVASDETILWKGRPLVRGIARNLFHIRAVMGYFAVLAVWTLASTHADGFRANAAFLSVLWLLMPAFIAAGIIYAISWVVSATTHYTITDRRVIMQIGTALPIALTLPLKSIVSADVRLLADGSGDIPMRTGRQKLAYLLIWPHARPWRFKTTEPMLRAVPDAARVAEILAQALLRATPTGEVAPIVVRPVRPVHGEAPLPAAA